MNPFTFVRAVSVENALLLHKDHAAGKYLGGGTNLVDLMRETIEHPDTLIDVSQLSGAIEEQANGGLFIGAAARNTAVVGTQIGAHALPCPRSRHPRRRIAANPQHGQRGRQPPATHPLHILLRRCLALQ
jgi:hypothetical protein